MGFRKRNNLVDYRQVKKVELDGRSFGSKAEAQGYLYLKAREQAGEIQNIRCQVKFELLPPSKGVRAIDYYVDFVYWDVLEKRDAALEIKGFETDKWKIKLKLYRLFGPMPLKIYKVNWNQLALDEEVTPKRLDPKFADEFKEWILDLPQMDGNLPGI